jgi:hypothetical protein
MGEPLSFMSLDMINLIAEELSELEYLSSQGLDVWSSPQLLSRDPVSICGDDLAAIRNALRRILQFKQTVKDLGMVLSWKDGISYRIMIFCEDHVLVTRDNTGKIVYRYIDVIKSRLLTTTCEQHGSNRAAILGKGRMLRNQVDYVEDLGPKVRILTLYRMIFDRAYNYALGRSRLPYFLPPAVGGAGFPVPEDKNPLRSLIPTWGWKYITYVLNVLENKDPIKRYLDLLHLRALNPRFNHGIDSGMNAIISLTKELHSYHYVDDQEWSSVPDLGDFILTEKSIYSDKFVVAVAKLLGRVVYPDPYDPAKFDWDSLKNEAHLLGFSKFEDSLTEYTRVWNFQTALTRESEKTQSSYNDWERRSTKFWRRKFAGASLNSHSERDERFKSFVQLEKAANYGTPGWVHESLTGFTIRNSGPTLKVNFSQLAKGGLVKINFDRRTVKSLWEYLHIQDPLWVPGP